VTHRVPLDQLSSMRWTSSTLFRVLQRAFHASAYRRATLDELKGPPLNTRLRPYQESCLVACVDALRAGVSRIGVTLPTGAGKTRVFISLLDQISSPPEKPEATRSLVIVNTIELARQAASQVEAMFPSWEVEIEQGGKHKASGEADVYVLLQLFPVSFHRP
jgi:superfamily II DNA or RNA helicase